MQIAELLDSVQYVTDHQGIKKGVLLDLDVWQGLVELIKQKTTADLMVTHEIGKQDSKATEPVGAMKREAAILREEAAFRQLHSSLHKQYAGQYVAIYNGQLIDSDSDQVVLYRRIRQQYPGEFVWIAPVNESPDEVLVFRSPRLRNGHS